MSLDRLPATPHVKALHCRRCGEVLIGRVGQKVQCEACLTVYSIKTAEAARDLLDWFKHSPLPSSAACVYGRPTERAVFLVVCARCGSESKPCIFCGRLAPPGAMTCGNCSAAAAPVTRGVQHSEGDEAAQQEDEADER